ncbi:UDP-glucose 6-dehydrogenase [Paenibacillus sp. 7516]|nr:UDP-glucose 6-dehydrogenase [Paenibacillus sp. 7516]
MNIMVVGTGYVGLTSGSSFAELGHNVVCVDIDERKINQLRQGIMPFYEPGLQDIVVRNVKERRLFFTTSLSEAIKSASVIFIAVGTPSLPNGSVDLSYVEQVAIQIGKNLIDYKIIVNKSTVPVGTADLVERIIKENMTDKKVSFDMASVPEFLREGSAVKDIFNGDRIVIGANNLEVADILMKLHEKLNIPIQITDIRSAELIKYAANSFLAMKISFINEIANIADGVGADVIEVAKGIGSDKRIGNQFLNAGIGFGGACFPKDVKGLIEIAQKSGRTLPLLEEVIRINDNQYRSVINKLLSVYPDLTGKVITILGLAFKPNTDDMRDAVSISLVRSLFEVDPSLKINVYDPIALEAAKQVIKGNVEYCNSIEEAISNSDAILIVTEWDEIVEFDYKKNINLLNNPVIIDGRNCLDLSGGRIDGFIYRSIGRKPI